MKKLLIKVIPLVMSFVIVSTTVNTFANNLINEDDRNVEILNQVVNLEGTVEDTGITSDNIKDIESERDVNNSNRYYYSNSSLPTGYGGGNLYSHTERQMYGELSGTVRKFKFYLYSKYDGTKTVESIKASWSVKAKLRSQATLSLSTSLSSNGEASITAGSSSTWQNVTTSKYYINTNGSKVVYDQSNFTCSPDSDLYGYEVSITNEATVKLKGDAKSYVISAGC